MTRGMAVCALGSLLALSSAAQENDPAAVEARSPVAAGPDWQALADVEVIEVLTEDEDGGLRESKVWFVLVDGEPHLRTSRSRWLENLQRDPEFRLRIGDREYPARSQIVLGEEIVEKVDDASVEKYGWQERFIHVFRIRKPDILRVRVRPE